MDSSPPRTHIFWREDIRNVLKAIDQANIALTAHLPVAQVAIYRAGFSAALQAVATSFDVDLDTPPPHAAFDLLPPSAPRRSPPSE